MNITADFFRDGKAVHAQIIYIKHCIVEFGILSYNPCQGIKPSFAYLECARFKAA